MGAGVSNTPAPIVVSGSTRPESGLRQVHRGRGRGRPQGWGGCLHYFYHIVKQRVSINLDAPNLSQPFYRAVWVP